MLLPLQTASFQAISAIGRSDILLKIMIFKRMVGVGLIVCALIFFQSVFAIVIAILLVESFSVVITINLNKRIFQYSAKELLKDTCPNLIISLIMGGLVYLLLYIPITPTFILCIQIIVGLALYFILSLLFKNSSFSYIYNVLFELFKKT